MLKPVLPCFISTGILLLLLSVPQLVNPGVASAQISDDQEHDEAGQQHPANHDELVLRGSSLDEPHDGVGEAQHVGHIQHLLVSSLRRSQVRGRQRSRTSAAYRDTSVDPDTRLGRASWPP